MRIRVNDLDTKLRIFFNDQGKEYSFSVRLEEWSDKKSIDYCSEFPIWWDFLLFPTTFREHTFHGYLIHSKIDSTERFIKTFNIFGEENKVTCPYHIQTNDKKNSILFLKLFPKWIPNKT